MIYLLYAGSVSFGIKILKKYEKVVVFQLERTRSLYRISMENTKPADYFFISAFPVAP